jgi:hypothetical protein
MKAFDCRIRLGTELSCRRDRVVDVEQDANQCATCLEREFSEWPHSAATI